VAVLGHLGVLFLLTHGRPLRKPTSDDGSMQLISIAPAEPQEVAPKPPDRTLTPKIPEQPRRLAPLARPTLSRPVQSPEPQKDESPRGAITDWEALAHDAADAILKHAGEAAQRRSFVHEFAPPPDPEKPGIFGSEKENHRAGRVDGDGTLFWTSDNCYEEIPRLQPLLRYAGEFHLVVPTCKSPPTGGGTHMLDDLTPEALRGPLPTPKAQPTTPPAKTAPPEK
jgi:hypothetical protein